MVLLRYRSLRTVIKGVEIVHFADEIVHIDEA